MCIGFAVGDAVYFAVAGALDYSEPFSELPALSVLVVTISMTAPMTAWMLYRGMPRRAVWEMTAVMPLANSWDDDRFMIASLDHAMWFHRPFRADEWLLYAMESPNASGGRGLALGRFFTRDGVLVASTAQEGVVRVWSGR